MKLKLTLLVIIALAVAGPARAATRFWDGSVNGNFNNAGNWAGNVVPVAGDELVFQAGVTRLLVTNDFSPNRAFTTITFQGSNYFVRGNAILLTNGILSLNPAGANHIDADVQVRASQFWEAQGPLASIDVNGDISLGANTLTVRANTGDFFFSGVITGTGNLVKTNVGTLRLDGSGHNTYSGFTRFDGGVLELDKFAIVPALTNFISIPGDLTIGDGNGLVGTDVLRLLADDQIADTSDVTVRNSGLFDLNDHDDRIGSLTMEGGTVDSGTGTLILGGDITTFDDPNSAVINGNLSLGGASRTFNVNSGAPGADLRINAAIIPGTVSLFATAGFTKTGGGSLFLAGTNTYNGITTVNEGQVALLSDRALGATTTPLGASARTVVSGNGNLFLSNVQVTNEDLTIDSANPGGAFNASGASVWTGDILLNVNTFISSSGSLLLNGVITGIGGFTKINGGSVTLAGTNANTYSGTTTVRDGTLLLDKDTTEVIDGAMSGPLVIGEDELPEGADVVRFLACCQLPDDTDITINSSGLLDLNDMNETTGAIDGRGLIDLGAGILREGADNDSSTLTGLIIGTGSLFKLGTGTWTLTGDNSYTGLTTVSAGTLLVEGLQPQSPVMVNGTANLGGSGVIGNLQVFGSVRPGTSPGILTCSNVNFASQGDFFVELNGAAPGSGYDQLNVRGTNQLGSSTLHVSVSGLAPFEGQNFVILNNDGSEAIVGTFGGLPNGSVITANGLQFRIRYSDIFLNDVVLTYTNPAARLVSASVAGGNGDGNIDLNECNFLNVVLTNTTGAILSGVTANLFPRTPGISVTFGTSAYPTMAANGRGTNTTPFQFSVGPGFVCGTNVDFDLVVQTPASGTFTVPVSLVSGSAGSAVRFNNNTATAIPDNGSVDLSVNVAGITTPIKRVVVSMHITHTADSDLDISLIGPDGTIINLSSDNGGSASDYGSDCTDVNRTTFADAGSTPITSASAPFVGTFRPEQPLSAFNEKTGADANGIWRLRVADDTAGGIGTVRCWSLLISPSACTDSGGGCESCPEDRVIRGILGAGSLVQTNRLFRDGTASTCGVPKTCPGVTGPLADRFYDAYTFENGQSGGCITVILQSGGCPLFSAAYTNSYNPLNLCQNYLADMGVTLPSSSYSFNVGPGARFVIVVNGIDAGDACGYTLSVDGGSCRPRLHVTEIPGNRVDLDWTTAAVGFLLERTNALRNPTLWPVVPGTPSISGGRFHVIDNMALPPTNNFYRLRKP